ncbi:hypothetical protein E2C01_044565 [Portunus trituberculatus]|uniref:Uncharacterized protein n=1 Tax=Portunus trituberculatus TaxID=210409 RepID=A0A5B7FZK2_PORTR|nr:hypothetical protein [Portunus trituberculatus]
MRVPFSRFVCATGGTSEGKGNGCGGKDESGRGKQFEKRELQPLYHRCVKSWHLTTPAFREKLHQPTRGHSESDAAPFVPGKARPEVKSRSREEVWEGAAPTLEGSDMPECGQADGEPDEGDAMSAVPVCRRVQPG